MNNCKESYMAFFQYEELVVNGYIIQTYYKINFANMTNSLNRELSDNDSVLYNFAFTYNGNPKSSNLNPKTGRRDLDFYFKTNQEAENFKKIVLSTSKFKIHSEFSLFGELKPLRTVLDIKAQLNNVIERNC
jgi:hypothetical protein